MAKHQIQICETPEECNQLAKEIVLAMLKRGAIQLSPVIVRSDNGNEPSEVHHREIHTNAMFLHECIVKIAGAIRSIELS